jgi:hypothetical protein
MDNEELNTTEDLLGPGGTEEQLEELPDDEQEGYEEDDSDGEESPEQSEDITRRLAQALVEMVQNGRQEPEAAPDPDEDEEEVDPYDVDAIVRRATAPLQRQIDILTARVEVPRALEAIPEDKRAAVKRFASKFKAEYQAAIIADPDFQALVKASGKNAATPAKKTPAKPVASDASPKASRPAAKTTLDVAKLRAFGMSEDDIREVLKRERQGGNA